MCLDCCGSLAADSRATDCLLLTEFEENQLTGYIISGGISPPFVFYKIVTTCKDSRRLGDTVGDHVPVMVASANDNRADSHKFDSCGSKRPCLRSSGKQILFCEDTWLRTDKIPVPYLVQCCWTKTSNSGTSAWFLPT